MSQLDFIRALPKAELHLHIEGSLEPELLFSLAERNGITLPFKTIEDVRAAYQFSNLQDFLDIYYQGMSVLITEQDFFDLTMAYLLRAKEDGVRHVEIFFDPQGHVERGIAFETVVNGIYRALVEGEVKHDISFGLIMCFLRHLSEDEAFDTLKMAEPFKDKLLGVGLDSSEMGHPPEKFQNVFSVAKKQGYKIVAHAGEEGPAEYVRQALDLLEVDRIDHGNAVLEDAELTQRVADEGIALTVCPLSNLKLCVVDKAENHPLPKMLEAGLTITLNSDDPAYFGGYIAENYQVMADAFDLDRKVLVKLAKNSIAVSFANKKRKQVLLMELIEQALG
ncbi:MAG: adenosine deaminase [Arenicellales bacterium]